MEELPRWKSQFNSESPIVRMSGNIIFGAVLALLWIAFPINSSPVRESEPITCPPCPTTTTECPPCETTTTCPSCTTEGPGNGGPGGPGGPGNGDEDGYGPPPDCTREQLPRLFPSYHAQFFWQCRSINDALLMPCGPGTVFSYELQLCTWP